ncbi:MAG TPA: SDR family NAD(P)-dependent oxidoreductase [Burkholderiales bacterium]|jgi:short-subunit dehydrogenase|nr:SDR family NAD(P)-dependent oxidoreductase [Burkholderiales bacterium]
MFERQCWWITGASSGIGEALARALSSKGASVILSGRNVAALETVAKDCPDALVLPFEATDYASIPALAERAWAWKGRVHGLVNNAGISQRSLAIDTRFEVYQRMIGVDLLAPIALTQAVLPKMVQAGGGRIVAIASVAGLVGVAMRTAYCAAKHGLVGYHDALRAENEHLGIKVHVVAPGSVRTDVSKNALTADGSRRGVSDAAIDNGLPPEEAAQEILAAIETEKRELVLAKGMEHDVVVMRRKDPEALFDRLSAMVRDGYAKKLAADKGGQRPG